MRILIRVDASRFIGLGHIKRCLSLAHALEQKGSRVHFVTRDLGISVASFVQEAGFSCSTLRQPFEGEISVHPGGHSKSLSWLGVEWRTDFIETVAAVREQAFDWIIVDHYSLEWNWHDAIKNKLGSKIAVIDDLADRKLLADLIVDHNYAVDHREKFKNCVPYDVPILGGPRFALLDQIYETAEKYSFSRDVKSIGIFMGGVDNDNYSSLALTACRVDACFQGHIEIATTSSNPHLKELVPTVKRMDASLTLDLRDLSAFYSRSDIQVGAGGGATWERCCIGVPTLAICVAENQKGVLEPLQDLGVLRVIREMPPTVRSMAIELKSLLGSVQERLHLAQHSRELVDGKGASRVADALRNMC